MNVLITGGAGYLGTSLCAVLEQRPDIEQITVYDSLLRDDRRFFFSDSAHKKVRFVRGDILDTESLQAAMQGHDALVHLAAYVDAPYHHTHHLQYDQINAYGTLSTVRAAEAVPELQIAFCLSSSAVLGFREDLHAGAEPAPENGYAVSKHHGEKYFALLRRSKAHVGIARSAQIFGVNRTMRFDSVLHAFLFEALTDGCVQVYGDGQQSRGFIAVNEVAERIANWLSGDGQTGDGGVPEVWSSFQANISELLEWLKGTVPEVEYRYLTPNIHLPSQRFRDLPGLDESALDEVLGQMRSRLSFKV